MATSAFSQLQWVSMSTTQNSPFSSLAMVTATAREENGEKPNPLTEKFWSGLTQCKQTISSKISEFLRAFV